MSATSRVVMQTFPREVVRVLYKIPVAAFFFAPLLLMAQSGAEPPASSTAAPSARLLDAVEEFRLQTRSSVDEVSVGQTTGTRAANNTQPQYHGRLTYYFRNNALDAIPHEIVQRGQPQRKLRRNQYQINVTGPVYFPKVYNGTNKTFFTFSYEGTRQTEGQGDLNTIPTTLERTGSWSHVVDFVGNPLIIYDPKTTFANPDYNPAVPVNRDNLQYIRLPFDGNIIPEADLDPVALEALAYYPQPNSTAGPFFRNNFFIVSQQEDKSDGFILTVDHTFLEKNRVTVRYNRSVGVDGSAPTFFTAANAARPPTVRGMNDLRLEHIYTASATTINTLSLRAGVQTFDRQAELLPSGSPFPRYDINGYQPMGATEPVSDNNQVTYSINDTFALRKGQHRLSFEANAQRIIRGNYNPRVPEGRFAFTPGFTSLPGVNNTGHGFASYLLGLASFAERGVVVSKNYFINESERFSVNDQWQVTPSLTLTVSANLNIDHPRYDKYDRLSNISLSEINPANNRPGALVVANQDGYSRGFRPTFTKVNPQIGIAYSVLGDNDTVLRLNYGRNYNAGGGGNAAGHFGTQAFNGTQVWLSPNQQLDPAVVLEQGLLNGREFPDTDLDAANGTSPDYIDATDRQGTFQFFNVEVQHQLAPFLILTASYRYQNGRNQGTNGQAGNPNSIPLSALVFEDQLNDLTFANSQRPFPQYQDFSVAGLPIGRDRGHRVQFRLEKRTSGGLAMSLSYTYDRSFDNSSNGIQNYYDLSTEWARTGRPHQMDFTYIYELPFGPGKRFLNRSGWTSQFIGGWAITGQGNINGGQILNLQAQFNNTGGVLDTVRPDLIPGVDYLVEDRGPELWFNPAAFAQPEDFTAGNMPRTLPDLRGPGFWNTDLTATKRFALPTDKTLEFSATMLNALNHANWNNPDTRIGTNVNAGRIVGSRGGRVVQLQLRLSF